MKLIYLFIGASKKKSSVQQKVVNQVNELNNHGINTVGWFFSTENIGKEKEGHIVYNKLTPYNQKHRLFLKYYKTNSYYRQILTSLDEAEFDKLFIRHGSPCPAYFKLLRKYADKIYLYIPSNVISEGFLERKVNKHYSFISACLSWFEYFVFNYLFHHFMFWFLLPKLKGVVAFTPEFATMLKRKSLGRAKVFYNRDGADCMNVTMRNYQPNEGKYKLIFLKGSSMQQPWAGLDRLVHSIKARPDLDIHLYITGRVFDIENYRYPFVTLTGRLEEQELNELINSVDIGVSNLANYLIKFNQTTNLKSRDYYARGLPFIQSNYMPDIEGTEGSKYYLNLPNDDSLLDMDKIISFIDTMRQDKEHPSKMRAFALNYLSWNKTVGELKAVIS